MKTTSMIIVTALVLSTGPATAQQGEASTVTTEVPQQQPYPECREINKGGPIAGIVVASVFWWLLPMSIPVWITQTKKLRKRRAEISEQQRRGCP